MEITAALVADLAILTQALDEPAGDIVENLRQLAADAKRAVASFLGVTVRCAGLDRPLTFTVLEPAAAPADVRASLMLPLPRTGVAARVDVIMYAARPGAFVDLAADVAWMTGGELTGVAVDEHLGAAGPADTADWIRSASMIDQAVGALIGRGHTPEDARDHLAANAVAFGIGVEAAAHTVLAGLASPDSTTENPPQ